MAALPAKYKPVQHYVKVATDHIKRDPAIAYYCYLYAVQKALEIDKKSPECRAWLTSMMDTMEKLKSENKETVEAFQNEVVGHAYIEDYTLKLFLGADNKDRAGLFDKALVKAFYTSGLLFDVLQQFGELSEELKTHQKYAKWKASYIHRCLQTGETPVAGPLPLEGDFGGEADFGAGGFDQSAAPRGGAPLNHNNSYPQMPPQSQSQSYPTPVQPQPQPQPGYNPGSYSANTPVNYNNSGGGHATLSSNSANYPQSYGNQQLPQANPSSYSAPVTDFRGATPAANLRTEDYQRATKLCKFAQSALQYEDATAAIDNLAKALRLLSTGRE